MNAILNILYSFIGSGLLLLATLYLYFKSTSYVRKHKAYAECWWLPAWACFRFVVRNMYSKHELYSIRYHSWLRIKKPSAPGSSVGSFLDTELTNGERIVLPGDQDLPLVCFRIENKSTHLTLVHTDKFGKELTRHTLTNETENLQVQYQIKVQNLGLTHEITRVFVIPFEIESDGKKFNVFQQLLMEQEKNEHKLRMIFQTSDIVSVAVQ